MATTLPGSPYVESSDLVANYPAVSEALAERVDLVGVLPFADAAARTTALPTPTDGQYSYLQDTNSTEVYNGAAWVASGITPGLVHINTTTFTSVASVSLNNIFTATYANYRIMVEVSADANRSLFVRLRASGSDLATNDYYGMGVGVISTAAAANYGGNNETGVFSGFYKAEPDFGTISGDIFRPNLVASTSFNGVVRDNQDGTTNKRGGVWSNLYRLTTVADGLSLVPSGGTITGNIRVYAYQNS